MTIRVWEPPFLAGEAAAAGREAWAGGDVDPPSCRDTDRPAGVASQAWYFAKTGLGTLAGNGKVVVFTARSGRAIPDPNESLGTVPPVGSAVPVSRRSTSYQGIARYRDLISAAAPATSALADLVPLTPATIPPSRPDVTRAAPGAATATYG
jgi:hypothetical protein